MLLSMQRIVARGLGTDAFEKRSFQETVAHLYSEMRFPFLHRIDATGSAERTQASIRAVVLSALSV